MYKYGTYMVNLSSTGSFEQVTGQLGEFNVRTDDAYIAIDGNTLGKVGLGDNMSSVCSETPFILITPKTHRGFESPTLGYIYDYSGSLRGSRLCVFAK